MAAAARVNEPLAPRSVGEAVPGKPQMPSEDQFFAMTAEQQRRALQAVARANGFRSLAEWARAAGLGNANSLYNLFAKRTNSLAPKTLARLARAIPGATFADVLGDAARRDRPVTSMPVRVEALAGDWRRSFHVEAPEGAREVPIPMVPGVVIDEVVRIGDDHADGIYPRGAYCLIESFARVGAAGLQAGDRVLVVRTRGDLLEVTIRQVVGSGADCHLAFRSNNPARRATVAFPDPYAGQVWTVDGDQLQVRGRVAMYLCLEAPVLEALTRTTGRPRAARET